MTNRRTPDRSSLTRTRGGTTADTGLEAVLDATRQLIWITTPAEAAAIVSGLITVLGGQIVPAANADSSDALPVDVSFGQDAPHVPVAPPLSLARLLLERHLPSVMVDAHRALALADKLNRLAADVSGQAVRSQQGVMTGEPTVIGHMFEQTQPSAQNLVAAEDLVHTVLSIAPFGMALVTLDGAFRLVNRSLCELLGYGEAWFLGRRLTDIIHPDDLDESLLERDQLLARPPDPGVGRTRLVRADGTALWVRRMAVPLPEAEGKPSLLLVQVQDITAEREADEALTYQAFHDSLTGLPNRARILASIELDLQAAKRLGTSVGVLCVKVDNFKVINDSLGHSAGDKVLKVVGQRIVGAVRREDYVGRLGGRDFVIVVRDVRHGMEVGRCAQRVSGSIAADIQVEGHRIVPSASIGIAISTPISTPESLLRDASSALLPASSIPHTPWQFFDPAMHTRAIARLTVEAELRDGITAGNFVVHYQPIVTLADARVVGHEALVRWAHPTRGLLSPADFLDVAEDTGLITAIGAQVFDQVCATIASRDDLPGPVSVNVSAVQLADPGWLKSVRDTLSRHGINPATIVIEVTETAVLNLVDAAQIALAFLRRLGVGIHVDDFGTGYSSICLLRDLPVTGVKLDLVFVHDLTAEPSQANALTQGLSGLIKGMHLTGIAEGVETRMQADILASQGWECAQGRFFGMPAPMLVTRVPARAKVSADQEGRSPTVP